MNRDPGENKKGVVIRKGEMFSASMRDTSETEMCRPAGCLLSVLKSLGKGLKRVQKKKKVQEKLLESWRKCLALRLSAIQSA